MLISAKLQNLRIPPRKVRLVADLIRGKTFQEAENLLTFAIKKGTGDLLKLLRSAAASAKNNFHLEKDNLYIKKIVVDEGRKYKTWMPRARGSATEIQKKTSHVTVILDEIVMGVRGKEEIKPAFAKAMAGKTEKPKFELKKEAPRPKTTAVLKRIFRRKSF